MSRTLVSTTTSGWFIDMEDPDGKRVRKTDGDTVLTRDDVERIGDRLVLRSGSTNGGDPTAASNGAKAAQRMDQPTTVAETGKILKGKTITITCTKRGCENTRTIKPQDRFQVKFCVEHQEEHRKEVRREKQRAKTKARREAREAVK